MIVTEELDTTQVALKIAEPGSLEGTVHEREDDGFFASLRPFLPKHLFKDNKNDNGFLTSSELQEIFNIDNKTLQKAAAELSSLTDFSAPERVGKTRRWSRYEVGALAAYMVYHYGRRGEEILKLIPEGVYDVLPGLDGDFYLTAKEAGNLNSRIDEELFRNLIHIFNIDRDRFPRRVNENGRLVTVLPRKFWNSVAEVLELAQKEGCEKRVFKWIRGNRERVGKALFSSLDDGFWRLLDNYLSDDDKDENEKLEWLPNAEQVELIRDVLDDAEEILASFDVGDKESSVPLHKTIMLLEGTRKYVPPSNGLEVSGLYQELFRVGERAKEVLFNYNEGLILSVIGKFNYSRYGIALDELYQVGAIGLLRAINEYDFRRGATLQTFAYAKIRGEITHYLRSTNSIPAHDADRVRQVLSVKYELWQILGREPS